MERPAGVAERVAQFGRVGAWGKQVLGKTASKKTMIIMLSFQSLARGWVPLNATKRANERSRNQGTRNGAGEVLPKLGIDNDVNHVNFTNDMAPEHQKPTNATDIGIKLVGHSRETEFSANRGLVIELFPFIFEASQRMSARAISRFLLEEQGVKLSAVTITKALNDPKKSWNAYFDMIEPSARVIAKLWRCETYKFLFAGRAQYENNINHAVGNPLSRIAVRLMMKAEIIPADKFLREKWFCINKLTLEKAKPYLESRLAVPA
jgi:hypothetical protein